jgi:hypothetical protein
VGAADPGRPGRLPPPFTPLYRTGDEWAAEIINQAVHGVLHLGSVPDAPGRYHGQLAVYAKPAGLLGTAYLAAIAPFRCRRGAAGPGTGPHIGMGQPA